MPAENAYLNTREHLRKMTGFAAVTRFKEHLFSDSKPLNPIFKAFLLLLCGCQLLCTQCTLSDVFFRAWCAVGPEGRSSMAISERIKSRLHAPMEVVVANFPVGTNEHDLMAMFSKYEPLNVRIMVNNSSQHPDDL